MLEDYLFLFIQPPSAVVRGPFLSPFSLLWRRSKRNLGSGSSMNQRENILIHSSAHTFWVLSTFFYFLFLFQNKKWKTQPSSLIFLQSPWINLLKKMWEQKGSIKCFIIVYTTAFGGRAGAGLSPFSLLWRRSKRNLGSGSSMNQREPINPFFRPCLLGSLSTIIFIWILLFQNKK